MNLQETVSKIMGKEVTLEYAKDIANSQFGLLATYIRETTSKPFTTELVEGLKVNVAERYLNDEVNENSDTSPTAIVRSVPTDDEELVCIEYTNGLIDHVPQDILEVITYTLSEGAINGIAINEKIRGEELFEYEIIDREDFVDTLIGWIDEARGNDKILMREDLELLLTVEDDYIFSSISTNCYLYDGCSEFNEKCEELLELSKTIK